MQGIFLIPEHLDEDLVMKLAQRGLNVDDVAIRVPLKPELAAGLELPTATAIVLHTVPYAMGGIQLTVADGEGQALAQFITCSNKTFFAPVYKDPAFRPMKKIEAQWHNATLWNWLEQLYGLTRYKFIKNQAWGDVTTEERANGMSLEITAAHYGQNYCELVLEIEFYDRNGRDRHWCPEISHYKGTLVFGRVAGRFHGPGLRVVDFDGPM